MTHGIAFKPKSKIRRKRPAKSSKHNTDESLIGQLPQQRKKILTAQRPNMVGNRQKFGRGGFNRGIKPSTAAVQRSSNRRIGNNHFNVTKHKSKAMELICKAKKKHSSNNKYLALSQKVVRGSQVPNEEDEFEEQDRECSTAYQQPPDSIEATNYYGYNQSREGADRIQTRHQKHRIHQLHPNSGTRDNNKLSNSRDYKVSGTGFRNERVKSVGHSTNHRTRVLSKPAYKANDVKGLKIVDYFNGMSRLHKYINKTKERMRSAQKGAVVSDKLQSKLISPFKKTLLNVGEIYNFVKQKQSEQLDQNQAADDEALALHDSHQMDDKAKWAQIMSFMAKNPKVLLDALPEPEPVEARLFYPAYHWHPSQEMQSNQYSSEMREEEQWEDAIQASHNN